MATPRLTTKAAEAAKPIKGKQAAHPDAQVPGLELRISPGGRKVWSFRYRNKEGRQRRMSLGLFPAVDVGDARDKAFKVLGSLADGADPASEQRKAKEAARNREVRTFGDLADAYLEACKAGVWRPKNKTKRASTLATETAVLKRHIRPRLGSLDLSDVTRRRIRSLLTDMTKAGIGARANKTHAIIRQVCAYGISEEHLILNPAMGFPPPADQKARARVLTDEELGEWWAALKDPSELRLPLKDGQTEAESVTVGRPKRQIVDGDVHVHRGGRDFGAPSPDANDTGVGKPADALAPPEPEILPPMRREDPVRLTLSGTEGEGPTQVSPTRLRQEFRRATR